jgi:hypothetical protein
MQRTPPHEAAERRAERGLDGHNRRDSRASTGSRAQHLFPKNQHVTSELDVSPALERYHIAPKIERKRTNAATHRHLTRSLSDMSVL